MHEIDAFLKSKSKFRCAIRKQREYTYFFDGIRYFTLFRGSKRESYPEEVRGFSDWEPCEDNVKETIEEI